VDLSVLTIELATLEDAWKALSAADIEQVVQMSNEKRFEIAEGSIRALYGHSFPQRLNRTAAAPPAVLFHGTARETSVKILQEGLRPMRRQYVHLSSDLETALRVGRRKSSNPDVLRVRSGEAYLDGVLFYPGSARIWLADEVPERFIERVAR
jgi:putative RNA 2'-phosphotransferase